jgi:hypothetical protein
MKAEITCKGPSNQKLWKSKNKCTQNKMVKGDTKYFYRYLGAKTTEIKDHSHLEEEVIMEEKYNTF